MPAGQATARSATNSIRVPPETSTPGGVDGSCAMEMLHTLRIAKPLGGWRGAAPVDIDALMLPRGQKIE